MTHCCIALGANLGDPEIQFKSALKALQSAGQKVLRVSSNYVTPPMGEHAGSDFQNAAAMIDATVPPEEFLRLLHHIESELGRTRTVAWGPRILDLDLLFYGDAIIETDNLVVPHPALWYRRFVLQPLNEIAGDWIHPVLQASSSELLSRLNDLPLEFYIRGFRQTELDEIANRLSGDFASAAFRLLAGDHSTVKAFASIEPGLLAQPQVHAGQPRLESERIIRLTTSDASTDDVTRLLRDILTAALPADECL